VKLEEALRKAIMRSGAEVLGEKRLVFILSDLSAFGEYPAVRQILEAIVSCGAGKELARLFLDEDRDWCLSYARDLRKSLSGKNHFREDIADYAVGSILFALGLQNSVTEPSDHGFDPVEHGSGAGHQDSGGLKDRRSGEDRGSAEGRSRGSSGKEAAGDFWREPSKESRELQKRNPEAAGSGGAASREAVAEDSSDGLKWLAAAVLLAIGFGFGWNTGSSYARSAALHECHSRGGLQSAADASDVGAHPGQYEYEEGEKHYYGRGTGQNYAVALEWYRKAADKGHPGAEFSIGWIYEYGQGVSRDYQTALSWYRKAAAQGNNDAEKGIARVEKLISDGSH